MTASAAAHACHKSGALVHEVAPRRATGVRFNSEFRSFSRPIASEAARSSKTTGSDAAGRSRVTLHGDEFVALSLATNAVRHPSSLLYEDAGGKRQIPLSSANDHDLTYGCPVLPTASSQCTNQPALQLHCTTSECSTHLPSPCCLVALQECACVHSFNTAIRSCQGTRSLLQSPRSPPRTASSVGTATPASQALLVAETRLVDTILKLVPPTAPPPCSPPSYDDSSHVNQDDAARGKGFEVGKVAALGGMYLAATYTSSLLETVKDAIVVTALGAEALPVLSLFFLLPTSVGVMMLYNMLSDSYSPDVVCCLMLTFLVGFYILFATVLYPMHGVLHPTAAGHALMQRLPGSFEPLVTVFTNWVFSLFFVFCELWNPVAISVLFYGTANEVCSLTEARNVYPSIGIVANASVVFAGFVASYVIKNVAGGSMVTSMCLLTATMAVSAAIMVGCKMFLMRGGYAKSPLATAPKPAVKKGSTGLSGAVGILKQSRSIALLCVLVACYGLSHKLFEFSWKGHLRTQFPSPAEYQGIMANVQMATGVLTLLCMVAARFVFVHLGWLFAAATTPVLLLGTGSAFFGLCLASKFGVGLWGLPPQQLACLGAYVGSAAQVFTRSTRYSLLDPAKEMSYLELSDAERSKGKAAVDMVGSQLGKSGASCIIQGLILACGSLAKAMPVVCVLFVGIVVFWLAAIRAIGLEKAEEAG